MEAEREEVVQGFVSSLPSLPSRVTRAFLSPARLPSVPPSIAAGPSILDSGSPFLNPPLYQKECTSTYYLYLPYLVHTVNIHGCTVPPTADCRD